MTAQLAQPLPLVHVGMAKAASTFLQQAVLPNLASHLYIGKHHNSPEMAKALMGITRRLSYMWDDAEARTLIGEAVAADGARRPVLYSEEDCSVFKFIDPGMIAQRLHRVLGPHNVLLIVRSPRTWVQSQYQFRLSTYHPTTLFGAADWFDQNRRIAGVGSDISEIRFARLAALYRDACGGRLTILPYELLVRDKAAFVATLAGALEVEAADLASLMDQPRNRQRDKTRITQADADFIKLARFILLRDLDTFWERLNGALEPYPEGRESEHYAAMEALRQAGDTRFGEWRPHLMGLRARLRRHFQEGEAADDPLTEEQLTFVRQVTRGEKAFMKRQFGRDLDAELPDAY